MSFRRIVSHDSVIRLLKGTIRRNRIPGAFLFLGEPFIGKTTTAIEYAKALNCLNSTDFDSCDVCISCKKIEKEIHPDFKKVIPEKDIIGIETIREIEEFLSLKTLEARYKVVILRNSERMNRSAANAFLKTLEEPPSNTVIILTCDNIDALPEPLVSRTFKVHFKPLPIKAIEEVINPEQKRIDLIKLSMGRPGILESSDLQKKIDFFYDSLRSKSFNKSPWKDNEDLRWWIDLLLILIRDKICEKLIKGKSYHYLKFEILENRTLENLFSIYEKVLEIRKNIDLNLNKSILWNYISALLKEA